MGPRCRQRRLSGLSSGMAALGSFALSQFQQALVCSSSLFGRRSLLRTKNLLRSAKKRVGFLPQLLKAQNARLWLGSEVRGEHPAMSQRRAFISILYSPSQEFMSTLPHSTLGRM